MTKPTIADALRLLLGACGIVAGAYCCYASFRNGQMITDGLPGIMFGSAFGAVVIASWFMLPWAEKLWEAGARKEARIWRVGWLLALSFVLANAIAYSAHYRTEAVEGKGVKIEAYTEAKADKARAVGEISDLKKNARWEATAGCSNATAQKSKEFCDKVTATQTRIDSNAAILKDGKPGAKDAGADTIAWVLSADPDKVSRSMPILWAVTLEVMASLLMKGAFTSLKSAAPAVSAGYTVASTAPVRLEPADAQQLAVAIIAELRKAGGKIVGQNKLARQIAAPQQSVSDALRRLEANGKVTRYVADDNITKVVELAEVRKKRRA